MYCPVSKSGSVVAVSNHQYRTAGLCKLDKVRQHDFGIFFIEITCGLIGEQKPGFVQESTRQSGTLPFSGAEFRGSVGGTACQVEMPDKFLCPSACIRLWTCNGRDENIFENAQVRDKIKLLENKTDFDSAEMCPFIV